MEALLLVEQHGCVPVSGDVWALAKCGALRLFAIGPIGATGVLRLSSNFNDVHPGKASSLRRSQRVCLNVDVEIILERAGGKSISELTKTLIVNAHGALILLNLAVSTGDLLRM